MYVIFINKSISLTQNGEAAIKRPNTKSSTRIVTMPDWYMTELKEYHEKWINSKLKVGDLWAGGDRHYVFHIGFGKPLYHSTPTHWWKRFTIRHNLKPVSLHSIRHSTASYLIQNNISMRAVQLRLGHARYQTTADLYTHIGKSGSREAADKFDKLNPKNNSVNNPSTSPISEDCTT
jgi:integrase